MVRLELALRGRSDVRILERGEILEDAPKTNRDRMVKLEASIRIGGALRKNAIVPDALFGLRFNNEEQSYFMLDRSGCFLAPTVTCGICRPFQILSGPKDGSKVGGDLNAFVVAPADGFRG